MMAKIHLYSNHIIANEILYYMVIRLKLDAYAAQDAYVSYISALSAHLSAASPD